MNEREFLSKIENYLNNQKKIFNLDNSEIFEKIKFKFMRDISELSEKIEDIKFFEIIQKLRIERKFKKIKYYSILNFKNIHLKRLNMRIFYYENSDKSYELYLSFNLNDRRFRNQKFSNISKIQMIKIKNKYMIQESKIKNIQKIS